MATGAIRNTCVARGGVAAGTTVSVYTVPTGFVFLLKGLVLSNISSAPTPVQVAAYVAAMPLTMYLLDQELAANTPLEWSPWIALNEDDQLVIVSGSQALNYWVSGALLPFADRLS